MAIITRLMGGLGNQMFQYAAGRALAVRLGAELKLDLSWFDSMEECTPRVYELGAFPCLDATAATPEECGRLVYARRGPLDFLLLRPRRHATSYVAEPHFGYWEGFERLAASAYLSGYWQNESYFKDIADTIRRDFAFPPLPTGGAGDMARRMQAACNSVAVHVRRGDYVSDPLTHQFHGVCSSEYYKNALEMLAATSVAEPELFLFSDDPAWVREHFDTHGLPAAVIDFSEHTDTPWHDMHLMSLCKHHIIANSSFSWWGAWLADSGGLVCAPRHWFAEESKTGDNPAPVAWKLL